ncbi:MAG TPA: polysaccharide biosynthesis/export family protein [Drouetiella sp.]
MRGLLQQLTTLSIASSLVTATFSPVFAAAEGGLKAQTPSADARQIAASDFPTAPTKATIAPRTFKLNAGITQEYVLGPGDVLSLTDLSSDDDKGSTSIAPVLPDGTAVVNYAGVIEAAGMSLRQMNELVNERAKKWFKNPEIVVNLQRQRPNQVYLLGEVVHPGLYTPTGNSNSPNAGGGGDSKSDEVSTASSVTGIFTVSTALELAGGLKETADIRHLHVTRLHPKQVIDVDLWKLMLDGDVSEDLVLQPGDVIYVPKGGAEFNTNDFGKVVANGHKVRITGAVKTPGLMVMSGDDDLLSVIAKAGGFTDTAIKGHVYLARTNRDGTITSEKVDMRFGKAMKNPESQARVKVRNGDVIVVKDSMTKRSVYAIGRYIPQMVMSGAMQMVLLRAVNTGGTTTK